jgi:SAM-dependent methyltransferase
MTWNVGEQIKSQARNLVYSPILNPMVIGPRPVRDFYYKSRLDHLLRFFGSTPFPKEIIDIGCNTGFFSFHLAREGSSVVGCDTDPQHIALALSLSGLYRLSPEFVHAAAEELLESAREYDAAILLTVLYHMIAAGTHERLLSLINARVRDFIIWESGDDPQKEIGAISGSTKFVNYLRIAYTYGTGKSRELGIFYREGWTPPRRDLSAGCISSH